MSKGKNRLADIYKAVGLPCLIIFLFLVFLCILLPVMKMQVGLLFSQAISRVMMNVIMVLAMVPSIEAGIGMNYGMPLGIICGLLGGMLSLEFGFTGFSGFCIAYLIAVPFAILAGWGYGVILNKVKGSESMIATYVGFSAVSFMCIVWMVIPVSNQSIKWPMGSGVRSSVSLSGTFYHVLDDFLKIQLTDNISIPTGLILFVLLWCGIVALFLRSRAGVIMKTAGANPKYAEAIGINTDRAHILGMIISTCLSALGILVYAQSYGFLEFYNAPLMVAFTAAAAVLIGGASNKNATVINALVGTVLFQSLLALAMPVANEIMPEGNLAEVARIIISNGIILYALTKGGEKK